jgi:hypothetical protein
LFREYTSVRGGLTKEQIAKLPEETYIIAREIWPKFFFFPGVYDPLKDKIFVHGSLSPNIRERVINHEKAHRNWWQRRSSFLAKLCIIFFGTPGVLFIGGILVGLLSIHAFLSNNISSLWCYGVLGGFLIFLHVLIWLVLLEMPAKKVDNLNIRPSERTSVKFTFGPFFPYLLPFAACAIGGLFGYSISLMLNLGLIATWLFILYQDYFALRYLRKVIGNQSNS